MIVVRLQHGDDSWLPWVRNIERMSICKRAKEGGDSKVVPFSPIRVLTSSSPSPFPSPAVDTPFLFWLVQHIRAQTRVLITRTRPRPHSLFSAFLLFSNGRCAVQHRFRFQQQQQSASAFPFRVHVVHFLSAFSAPVVPRPSPARSSPFYRRVLCSLHFLHQSGTRTKQLGRLPLLLLLPRLRPHHPRRLAAEPQSGKPSAGEDAAQTDAHPSTRRRFAVSEGCRERPFVLIRDRRHLHVPITLRAGSVPFRSRFHESPTPPAA